MFEVMFKVKNTGEIFRVQEGTGDNLSLEDFDNLFVDYIDYDELDENLEVKDGGILLLREHIGDSCDTDDDFINLFMGNMFGKHLNQDEYELLEFQND